MKKIILMSGLFVLGMGYAQSQEFGDPTRTEFKDDAGQQGSKSGFFQTAYPSNYPTGANGWWHLLDIRHTNTTNNYAMQFAGSFFDQSLYFRKVSDSPSQPWSRVVLENSAGNVGIGTLSPQAKLDVNGVSAFTDRLYKKSPSLGGNNPALIGAQTEWEKGEIPIISLGYEQGAQSGTDIDTKIRSYARQPSESYNFITIGQNRIDVSASNTYITGNVGIGTSNPTDKLSVNGNIRAKEIKVEETNWADYVFKPDYKLMTLSETEAHIKAKGHLPNIPSATEVAKDGINLGEMNKKLLEKIEELTLHLIEQSKLLGKQSEELQSVKSRLIKLESSNKR